MIRERVTKRLSGWAKLEIHDEIPDQNGDDNKRQEGH